MAGWRMTDAGSVRALRRAARPAVVCVLLLVLAPSAAMAQNEGAADPPPSTTTTSVPSPAATAAPGETTTAPSSTTTTVSEDPETTSTTSAAEAAKAWRDLLAGDADFGEPLPPATAGPLPSEDELPPPSPDAPPPVPPPGANEAGQARGRLELRSSQAALGRARATELRLAKQLLPLGRRLGEARDVVGRLTAGDRLAADELASAKAKVKRIAIAGYIRGGDTQPVDYLLQASDPIDLERRRTIIEAATEARKKAVDSYALLQRGSSLELQAAVKGLEGALAAFSSVEAETVSASAVVAILAAEVEERRLLLDHAAASAAVGGTDIPRLFHDAYRKAAATLTRRAPHCRVPWTAIAAIGKVESNHGRYRGSQFALNGDVYPRILGIPLDGTRSALIRDTDLGVLDTDVVFDRAVGPMQFIPSTWVRINEDGNNDRASDPNNVYDAALGTAAYLCRAVPAGGLDTDEGLRPAFFSYNHSDAYVAKVLAWHHGYAGTTPTAPAT